LAFGILGTGSAYPERVMTNFDFEKIVDTSDEWIRTRTGISERHIADPGTATSDIASAAGRKAIEAAGLESKDIDLIIVGTFTPDTPLPSAACYVQQKLDIPDCPAFDVNAACTGFLTALTIAHGLLTNGIARKALVIGADCTTKYTDFTDRNTCVLFGDGAGAVVLGEVEEGRGILAEYLGADGRQISRIIVPGGGSANPPSHAMLDAGDQYVHMEGNEVYKFAIRILPLSIQRACEIAGVQPSDLDWLVPHQANVRIIEAASKRFDVPMDRIILNLDRFGNTSAASVPLALDEAVRDGRIKRNDLIGMVAFGSGLTWGSVVLRF
jgi:3-oxoacyl-[acyl-carrier-protein] synthase-3